MKRPQMFGEWLEQMLDENQVTEIMLAAQMRTTVPSVLNWKKDSHLPKLVSVLAMVDYFSKVSGESPEDILLEMLDSVPKYRIINKEHRERQRKKSNDS
jgi:hypothetical protein